MTYLLETHLSKPLEREYEAWVVLQAEKYFRELGVNAEIWAVSPQDESTWPADEHVLINGKLIGLQFKQTKLAPGNLDYTRVKWSLHKPDGQFELIQKHPEIFYALPTFINRKWHYKALEHCIFWRPQEDGVVNYNIWYHNENAAPPYNKIAINERAYRWGHLIERILNCEEGLRVNDFSLLVYLTTLKADFTSNTKSENDEVILKKHNKDTNEQNNSLIKSINNRFKSEVIYLFYIPFNN